MAKIKYLVDIDLSNNQLLNTTLQNLSEHPNTDNKVSGFIYWNTTDSTAYVFTGQLTEPGKWIDLGSAYTHPSLGALNLDLTGATVLAKLKVSPEGHVIEATTRTLTATDIGAEPAFEKNSGFNRSFGATAGTVVEGDDPRLANGDKHYTHEQSSPSTHWICQHNLNKKVSVTVVDSAGSIVEGQVTINDGNLVEVHFNIPFWGYAHFN